MHYDILKRNSEEQINKGETFLLYRGLNCLEQAIAIFEQGTAGGWKKNENVNYPGRLDNKELEMVLRQKTTNGEVSPSLFQCIKWEVGKSSSFIEYTANEKLAHSFGLNRDTIRGGLIKIEIEARYVNDIYVREKDGAWQVGKDLEMGLFCASAAPIIIKGYMLPNGDEEMIAKFNYNRKKGTTYKDLIDKLNQKKKE